MRGGRSNMSSKIVEINDYYEYELDVRIEREPGKLFENIAIVEVRLYEKATTGENNGSRQTRSLINTFKQEVKRPNLIQFLLGLSWQDRIKKTENTLRNKAIYKAAELWHNKIFPKKIQEIVEWQK